MSAFAPRRSAAESVAGPLNGLAFEAALFVPMPRVFAALTEDTLLTRWFCDRAESEVRAGGRIELAWNGGAESFVGHWTTFEPFRACAYVGGHAGYPDGDAGLVEFALEPGGAGAAPADTSLAVRHTLPSAPEFDAIAAKYRSAWPRALARLEALLAVPVRQGA